MTFAVYVTLLRKTATVNLYPVIKFPLYLSFTVHFKEFLNLNLTFAACRKRDCLISLISLLY